MIKRGDIYFIRDTRQSIGSEQKADRPANTFYNKFRVENINRIVRADKQRLRGTDRRMDRNTHTGRNETA